MIIYAYTTALFSKQGWLKVGQVSESRKDVLNLNDDYAKAMVRIKEQDKTSNPEELRCVFAQRVADSITDKRIHAWFSKNRVCKPRGNREWFECTVADITRAINALSGHGARPNSFGLRAEQQEAVDKAFDYFKSTTNADKRFLWNAKMRFGKTFSAYMLAKKMNASRVLVLTYKPSTVDAWSEDLVGHTEFQSFEFMFLGDEERKVPVSLRAPDASMPLVVFSSFQLLNKNRDSNVFDILYQDNWDLVIVDEVHYGLESDLAFQTLAKIKRSARLDLSGTPFKLLAGGALSDEQVFEWTYADEQRERQKEIDRLGEQQARRVGKYYWLSPLRIYTFKPGSSLFESLESGMTADSGFSANLFFASTDGEDFVRSTAVRDFLDELAGKAKKPQLASSVGKKLGSVFKEVQVPGPGNGDVWVSLPCKKSPWLMKHTFWYLPDVNACHAMKRVLSVHSFFKDFEVICASGDNDGQGSDTLAVVEDGIALSMSDARKVAADQSYKNGVIGTITLSCGKLNTGVTVPEWSAILMLNDTGSSQDYFQTIFRAQSPWHWSDNGDETGKDHCFVFDFNPNRVLKHIYDDATSRAKAKPPGSLDQGGFATDLVHDTLSILNVFCCEDGALTRINENDVIDSVVANGTMRSLLAKKFISERMLGQNWLNSATGVDSILNKISEAESATAGQTIVSATPGLPPAVSVPKDSKPKSSSGNSSGDGKAKLIRREKIKNLCGRLPFFIYLAICKPRSVQKIVASTESELFETCCGISQTEFALLISEKVLDEAFLDDSITLFLRYELIDLEGREQQPIKGTPVFQGGVVINGSLLSAAGSPPPSFRENSDGFPISVNSAFVSREALNQTILPDGSTSPAPSLHTPLSPEQPQAEANFSRGIPVAKITLDLLSHRDENGDGLF